jgi:membrane protease YdiL (CAAX protease family)
VIEEQARSENQFSGRWRRWDLAAAAVFFLGAILFFPTIVLLFLRSFRPDLRVENLSGVEQISIQALLDLFLVGIVVFLIKAGHGWPVRESLRWIGRREFKTTTLVLAGAGMALLVIFVSLFLPETKNPTLEKLLSTTPSIIAFVVFGIALAPFLEEVLFRGFLYTALADVYSARVAIPITSVLFGVLHLDQQEGNWPAAILILGVGLSLTWVRHRTGSLVPSVIMHTTYNAVIFGVAALSTVLDQSVGK